MASTQIVGGIGGQYDLVFDATLDYMIQFKMCIRDRFGSIVNAVGSAASKAVEVVNNVVATVKKTRDGISSGGGTRPGGSSGGSSGGGSGGGSSGGSTSGSGSSGGSGSSSKKDVDELFDWIEIRMARLSREIENLVNEADASIGYLAKNEKLSEAMEDRKSVV